MEPVLFEREPVRVSERNIPEVRRLDHVLGSDSAYLVASTGQKIEIPEPVYRALRQAVHLMAQGHAVAIVPYNKLLTTQQAADLLNVSRPYLVGLLESGAIHFERVGAHRRVRFDDLMRYKAQRDRERHDHLNKLTRMSDELGMYKPLQE